MLKIDNLEVYTDDKKILDNFNLTMYVLTLTLCYVNALLLNEL